MPLVCGRLQVYLGGYDSRDQASRAHDIMVRVPSSCMLPAIPKRIVTNTVLMFRSVHACLGCMSA